MNAAPDLRKLEIVARVVGRKRRSNPLMAQRGLFAFLLTTLFIPALNSNVYGQNPAPGVGSQAQLHVGIEIDPEGIKVAVIRISDTAQKSGAEIVFTEVFNVELGRDQGGKFSSDVDTPSGRLTRDYSK